MKEMIRKYRGTLISSALVILAGVLVGFTKITIGISKMSLKNKCKSVDTPTTGRSAMCCKRTNAAAEPQCI